MRLFLCCPAGMVVYSGGPNRHHSTRIFPVARPPWSLAGKATVGRSGYAGNACPNGLPGHCSDTTTPPLQEALWWVSFLEYGDPGRVGRYAINR